MKRPGYPAIRYPGLASRVMKLFKLFLNDSCAVPPSVKDVMLCAVMPSDIIMVAFKNAVIRQGDILHIGQYITVQRYGERAPVMRESYQMIGGLIIKQ